MHAFATALQQLQPQQPQCEGFFESLDCGGSHASRQPLATVTNHPVSGEATAERKSGSGVVAEIREAVRLFQSRRMSEIAQVGEFALEEVISDRPEAQVWLARRFSGSLVESESFFVVKRRAASVAPKPEVQALSLVTGHKNIVEFFGAEYLDDSLFIYMEFPANHVTLQEYMRMHASVSEAACVKIARGLLDALSHVHSCGVLHGDLKPANVLVDAQLNQVKLIDFGAAAIANPRHQASDEDCGSSFSGMRGTVQFCAPEILRGETCGFNADCWSLGCCLAELVSGQPPFGIFDNVLAATYAILASDATPLDAIDARILTAWSSVFRSFLRTVFVRDKLARPQAHKLKLHPWIYLPIN